jgi:hypothetical protein
MKVQRFRVQGLKVMNSNLENQWLAKSHNSFIPEAGKKMHQAQSRTMNL